MKRLLSLVVITVLIITVFTACNNTDVESTPTNDSDAPTTEATTNKPTEPPSNPGASETTNYIPTDPESLGEILEGMELADVDIVTGGDFLGYGSMGNLECVVAGMLPDLQEDVIFFYCADTDTADYIESYYTKEIASVEENYYAVKRENNIVFFGPAEVWDDFIVFTPDNSEQPSNPGTSETTNYIPTDPEALGEILEGMELADVDIVTGGDFLGYGSMGNLECVVAGMLPGPQEDVIFFYCADTDTADYIESYYTESIASSGGNYYAVKRENNIVFFGPAEVWEALSK